MVILGNSENSVKQSLVLGPKVNLTGRNEIRLAPHANLTVDNGTVSSVRRLEIYPDATLGGTGTIDATVYNHGSVAVDGAMKTWT